VKIRGNMKPLAVFAIAATFAAAAIAQPFTISTIAGAVTQPLPALNAGLSNPQAIAADTAGHVADTGNFRVVKMNETGIVTTVAGNGSQGYSGDGGPGAAAQLQNPTGLAFDPSGNLFIGDGVAVRMVSPDGVITTVAGVPA
jgi:hypothetical protein